MEPMNADVRWTSGALRMWGPTQNGEGAFAQVLAASGSTSDKVDVHNVMLGGGFGRRGTYPNDYVGQAVLIAKQMPGTPVKADLVARGGHGARQVSPGDAVASSPGAWTRAATSPRCTCGSRAVDPRFGSSGSHSGAERARPAQFPRCVRVGRALVQLYVPNLLIDHAMRNTHVPPGFWRGVNVNQNAVFIECFMDELAEAAGQDALEFRRKLMAKHPRNLGVLNAVAERIGWSKPAPSGVYRGLAHLHCFDSFVAAACEISVKDGNKVKVHRIVAATDPGYAVNPAQIERQVAGSFVYGLSALFMQECTVKDGRHRARRTSTSTTRCALAQMPKVETILMRPAEPCGAESASDDLRRGARGC